MRLRELRDIYLNQDIYIVGSGPTTNLFPFEFLKDKICLALNDAYKIHPAITPIALMNNQVYAHTAEREDAPYHEYFKKIKYPIVKPKSRYRVEKIEWEHPYFYYFDRSLDLENINSLTKETDYLYYTPEGCSLHPALQLCWIFGAKNIFVIGCDSCTFQGEHYASYNKNGIGKIEAQRSYDSYIYGTLIIQEFLKSKGINVLNLSPIVGYHRVEYQYDVLKGKISTQEVLEAIEKL
jgi:hypothetical protein